VIPYGGAEDMVRRYLMSGDVVSLVKQDGRRMDGIEARVQTDLIMIGDTALPIEEGDYIIRSLPSGLEERYQVLDKGYNVGLGPGRSGIPPHYRPVAKFLTKCYIVPDNYVATALRGAR